MRTLQLKLTFRRDRSTRRSGSTQVQTGVILALIAVGVIAGVRALGTNASGKIASTATGVGNPAALVGNFSGSSSGGSSSPTGGTSGGSSGSGTSGSTDGSTGGGSGSDAGSSGGDAGGGLCP